MTDELCVQTISLPGGKKKNRIKLKVNDEDEYHILSAHYLRTTGLHVCVCMVCVHVCMVCCVCAYGGCMCVWYVVWCVCG